MKPTKVVIAFAQGVAYACATLIKGYDQPTIAKWILKESGFFNDVNDFEKYEVSEFDSEILIDLFKENNHE